jgi:hypothetical protein
MNAAMPPLAPEVTEQMLALRAGGASYHLIAATLNRGGARGRAGGRWFAASVRRAMQQAMNNNQSKEQQCKV